jgi:heptosyltransferase I
LRTQLRGENFETVLDLQGLLKSAVWGWLTGAPRRIGLGAREHSGNLQTEIVDPQWDHRGRFCHEYRNLIEHLGLPGDPFGLSLHPTPVARARVEEIFKRQPEAQLRPPVMLLPFTTRPQKHWFAEKWAALADALHERFAVPVWILGGPGDAAAAEAIADAARQKRPFVIAGPETDLPEKLALLSRASVAVGVDTGLTHMSLGLGTPTVALFGSTCPYIETAPIPGVVLYKNLACAPCRRFPTCDGAFTCMRDIRVEEVLQAVEQLNHAAASHLAS